MWREARTCTVMSFLLAIDALDILTSCRRCQLRTLLGSCFLCRGSVSSTPGWLPCGECDVDVVDVAGGCQGIDA